MIVQCPACRELAKVERALVNADGSRAGLCCSACGVVTWLPADVDGSAPRLEATRARAPEDEPAVVLDPKLEEAVLGLPATTPGEQAVVDGLRELLPRWHDAEAHRALIRRAHTADSLPALGVRYRRVLEALPHDEASRRAQQEILGLAMATFSTRAGPPGERTGGQRAQTIAALVVVAVFAALAIGFLLFTLKAR